MYSPQRLRAPILLPFEHGYSFKGFAVSIYASSCVLHRLAIFADDISEDDNLLAILQASEVHGVRIHNREDVRYSFRRGTILMLCSTSLEWDCIFG